MSIMREYRFAIIDGTGPFSDADYRSQMKDSFCSQIYDRLQSKQKFYHRGPSGDGFSSYLTASKAYRWIMQECQDDPAMNIYLAGYSRGAWETVIVADWLKEQGRRVTALFLFDPVRMQLGRSGITIPTNVDHVYIARRLPDDPSMDVYDHSTSRKDASHNPVRRWWGVTSLNTSGIRGREQPFLGSHGALGGVGWSHVVEDGPCQVAVADFMTHALADEGFRDITLRSLSRPSNPIKDWKRPQPSRPGLIAATRRL